ncbi:hypothetical protein C7H73_14670 [Pulveribacter suum]|uniref:Uncharacterized protein n=1 Tax=Pulveribacter suum TaxID=2116657 RepID=A0A2P1NP63_9BURK|nr:hypothetical protein C7H73_14670 [Pulveribacter suum]
MQALLDAEQRDRARDRGHFTQYGMRIDPRDAQESARANPGTGDRPRRFGAGGDPATYANRADLLAQPQTAVRDDSSDAPAHPSIP